MNLLLPSRAAKSKLNSSRTRKPRRSVRGWFSAFLIFFLASLFSTLPAQAADNINPRAVSFIFDNDHFNNTDRHYTNGISFGWIPTASAPPEWALALAHKIPFFQKSGVVHHGYSLGQSTFTPSDLTLDDPPTDDRPYAGWLYGSIGMESKTDRQLDQLILSLGVVGPASLAELGQKALHKARAVKRPSGWNNQLENEPGIVLSYQRRWRLLASKNFELAPHTGGTLGNVFTYACTGLTLRVGNDLPLDHGPPRIQPGVPGSMSFVAADQFAWYLFTGIEGRAMARNIFLDGNSYRDSRSVDKETFVGDLQLGGVLVWRHMRLSYTHVLRTSEYKNQGERDDFGSISLTILH